MLSCHLALPRQLYTVFLPAVGGAGEGSGSPGLSDPSLSTSVFPPPVPSLSQGRLSWSFFPQIYCWPRGGAQDFLILAARLEGSRRNHGILSQCSGWKGQIIKEMNVRGRVKPGFPKSFPQLKHFILMDVTEAVGLLLARGQARLHCKTLS